MYKLRSILIYIVFIVDISDILSKAPNLKDALSLLIPISDKWYTFGCALDIESNKLNSLQQSLKADEEKLSKVIIYWQNRKASTATWKELLEVVEGKIIDNHQVGEDIRQFLANQVYSKEGMLFEVMLLSLIGYTVILYIQY